MKNELEILKDKSLAVFGEKPPPKNAGQRKLLEYINQCVNLNNPVDTEQVKKLYLKACKSPKGEWSITKSSKLFIRFDDALKEYGQGNVWSGNIWHYRDGKGQYGHIYAKGIFKKWDLNSYKITYAASTWFTRSLGTLVKNGHLMIIPKGYVLKKINENK